MWTLAYGITRSKLTHGMSQHGRPLCRHSLGAGTERRERIYEAKVAGFCPTCGLRRVPAALSHRHARPLRSASRSARFAAWLGLVPKQISTGDRTILGKISKRGNRYLRA